MLFKPLFASQNASSVFLVASLPFHPELASFAPTAVVGKP
ncbi:exported hypothetical protein [Syntrophaceticus schinkii]|uniref:Uncharacterized protein n=1 Tax=Syntrophaceticus schinkii TaxID=499207 RepID=A0A0B7MMB7_9FIRM|nr:exported hypothetical protein [Syntrophaceticus schinkii]